MASTNKRRKGINRYLADLGLKSGGNGRLRRVQFYTASQRQALKRELKKEETK